jgi:hypothetical protein
LFDNTAKGDEKTLGLAKSIPAPYNKPSKTEPVNVKPKLTKNWTDNRLSLPNISFEITAERTNVQANEQIKTITFAEKFSAEAIAGLDIVKEDEMLVTAVFVKIW